MTIQTLSRAADADYTMLDIHRGLLAKLDRGMQKTEIQPLYLRAALRAFAEHRDLPPLPYRFYTWALLESGGVRDVHLRNLLFSNGISVPSEEGWVETAVRTWDRKKSKKELVLVTPGDLRKAGEYPSFWDFISRAQKYGLFCPKDDLAFHLRASYKPIDEQREPPTLHVISNFSQSNTITRTAFKIETRTDGFGGRHYEISSEEINYDRLVPRDRIYVFEAR